MMQFSFFSSVYKKILITFLCDFPFQLGTEGNPNEGRLTGADMHLPKTGHFAKVINILQCDWLNQHNVDNPVNVLSSTASAAYFAFFPQLFNDVRWATYCILK